MNAEEVARAEMAAWNHLDVDEAMRHFAQDAVYDIGPSYPEDVPGLVEVEVAVPRSMPAVW